MDWIQGYTIIFMLWWIITTAYAFMKKKPAAMGSVLGFAIFLPPCLRVLGIL